MHTCLGYNHNIFGVQICPESAKRRSPIWQDKKAERNKAQIYDVLSHKFSICILRHIIKETRIYPSTLTNVGFVEEDGVLKGKSNCEVIKWSMGQIPGGV